MRTATISRFGERYQADDGCDIRKIGVNQYLLLVRTEKQPRVFVEALTGDRVSTVMAHGLPDPWAFDIFTFNLLNGHHPGSDLRVRILEEDDPELLAFASFEGNAVEAQNCAAWREDGRAVVQPEQGGVVLVQPHARDFRMPQVTVTSGGDGSVVKEGDHIQVETLITRTPPTPLETNIEVAVIRALGPIHSR